MRQPMSSNEAPKPVPAVLQAIGRSGRDPAPHAAAPPARRSAMRSAALAIVAGQILVAGGLAHAIETSFTASGTASWGTAGNWSAGVPTASDVARFNATTSSIVTVPASQTAAGIIFNNSNNATFRGEGGNRFLELGAQGIVVDAGTLTIGVNTDGSRLGVRLAASQSWVNNRPATAGDTLVRSAGGSAGIDLQGFTLTLGGTGGTSLSGPLTGSGGIVKSGSGAVNFLSNNPNFTGGVVMNGGFLQISDSSGANSGPLGNPASSVLTINGGTLAARGTAGATRTVSNPMVWSGDFTVGPPPTVALVNLALTGAVTLSGANTVRTVTVGNADGSPTFSVGGISDGNANVGLTKNGAGTLVILGDSSYTGVTTVSAGTLQLGNGGTAGSVAGDVVLNGAATRLVINRSTGATLGGSISGSGSIQKDGAGSLTLTGSNSYTGSLTVNAGVLGIDSIDALPGWDTNGRYSIAAAAGITFGNGVTAGQITTILTETTNVSAAAGTGFDTSDGDRTFSGNLAGAFPDRTIIKTGSNALILTGSSVLATGRSVSVFSGGSLKVDGGGALSGDVTVLTGGTLQVGGTGAGTVTGAVTVQSGGFAQVGDGGTTGTIVGNVSNAGTLSFNRSDDIAPGGTISGAGAIVQSGSGRLTLSTVNPDFSGALQAPAGTVRVTNGGALGTGTISPGGGTASGTVELAGGISLTNALVIGSRNNATSTNFVSLRNVSGTNSVTGNVSIPAGGNVYELASDAGLLRLTGNWSASGTAVNSARTIRLTGDGDFDIAGSIPIQGTTAFSFTKSGTGTVSFGGTRDMAGTTTVTAGRLLMNPGSLFSNRAGTVTIASGATLAGSGTLENVVTIDGIHSPGSSPGLQIFTNNLDYNATGSLVWELSGNTDATAARGTVYDGVNVTGAGGQLAINTAATLALVFDAPLANADPSTVNFTDAFWNSDRAWQVISLAGGATGNGNVFGTVSVGADASGNLLGDVRPLASFSVASQPDGVYLLYAAVPEPTTSALLVIGAASLIGVVAHGRRRNRGSLRTGDR
jgi:fibronectin-binding autotransporter adhesin